MVGREKQDQGRRAKILARSVRSYAAEIAELMKKVQDRGHKENLRWRKPEPGFLKINCDASFHKETGTEGWGFIIRDSNGDVICAGKGRLPHVLDSFQAEAVACLQGLQAAIDAGIAHMTVETDALLVKQAVLSEEWRLSLAGGLILEI